MLIQQKTSVLCSLEDKNLTKLYLFLMAEGIGRGDISPKEDCVQE